MIVFIKYPKSVTMYMQYNFCKTSSNNWKTLQKDYNIQKSQVLLK